MNTNKSILMASVAAACFLGAVPSAVEAAGTAHVASQNDAAQHKRDLQQSLDDLENATSQLSAPAGAEVGKFGAEIKNSGANDKNSRVIEAAKKVAADAKKVAGDKNAGVQSIDGIPSAENNFKDDDLNWPGSVRIYPMKQDQSIDLTQAYCLEADKTVYGMSKDFTAGPKPEGDGDKPAPNYLRVQLDHNGSLLLHGTSDANAKKQSTDSGFGQCVADSSDTTGIALTGTSEFFVSEDDAAAANRTGWDFGTLVVPFKFQLSDKSAVTASASLGGYLGYRLPDIGGIKLRPVMFAGLSEVPVEQLGSDGKATTETVAGLSYGLGVIGTIKDDFSVGLIFGADHVDSIQQYKYQDKPWVSLVLGLSLTK